MWSFELCRRCVIGFDTTDRNVSEMSGEDVSKLKERIKHIAPHSWGPSSVLHFYTCLARSLKGLYRKNEVAEIAVNKMKNRNYDLDVISEAEDLLNAIREDINAARFMQGFIEVHFKSEVRYAKAGLKFSDLKKIAENTDRCN